MWKLTLVSALLLWTTTPICLAHTFLEAGAQLLPCENAESEQTERNEQLTQNKNFSRVKRDLATYHIRENLYGCKWRLAVILSLSNKGKVRLCLLL